MTANRRRAWSAGAAGPVLRLTPAADPHDTTWRDFAACAETDPELFFPELGVAATSAVKVCRRCPVAAQCLDYALANNEQFGVWGGKSFSQRREMRRAGAA